VKQNVEFWASTVGATAEEVRDAMARMRIDGRLANVKAAQLSAGQRRRTALASLIVRRAEVWLLDEPHAGLDAAGRDELDELLRSAVRAGATVVLASHESERAAGLATRTVTIDGGGAQ
jgi:ABC-type transport system involved in cytochrome c biogenesis ATPase subunit